MRLKYVVLFFSFKMSMSVEHFKKTIKHMTKYILINIVYDCVFFFNRWTVAEQVKTSSGCDILRLKYFE